MFCKFDIYKEFPFPNRHSLLSMVKILTTSVNVNNTDNKATPLNGSHDFWSRNKRNNKPNGCLHFVNRMQDKIIVQNN